MTIARRAIATTRTALLLLLLWALTSTVFPASSRDDDSNRRAAGFFLVRGDDDAEPFSDPNPPPASGRRQQEQQQQRPETAGSSPPSAEEGSREPSPPLPSSPSSSNAEDGDGDADASRDGGDTDPEPTDGNEEVGRCDDDKGYRCGAYSLATPLRPGLVNWTAVFEGNLRRSRRLDPVAAADDDDENHHPGLLFLEAGVSCAYHPVRTIFDNDFNKRNDPKADAMDWDGATTTDDGGSGGTATGGGGGSSCGIGLDTTWNVISAAADGRPVHQPFHSCLAEQLDGDTRDDYIGIELTVPKIIKVRIHAVDDDLEFRYRSFPCGIVEPVLEGAKKAAEQLDGDGVGGGYLYYDDDYDAVGKDYDDDNDDELEFGEKHTLLRFVWNREAQEDIRRKYGPLARFLNWLNDSLKNLFRNETAADDDGDVEDFLDEYAPLMAATLELWVPRYVLETVTVRGPMYDYELEISVDGDLVDSAADANNGTNATRQRLLTGGPPRTLSVRNDGIGTSLNVDVRTTSSSSGGDNTTTTTNLTFVDLSLNGDVRINVDAGVGGTIHLNGSNTRTTLVRRTDDHESDSAGVFDVSVGGFGQTVSVKGDFGGGPAVHLGGFSNELYMTEGCPAETIATSLSSSSICRPLVVDAVHREEEEEEVEGTPRPSASIVDDDDDDDHHRSCLALDNRFFEYNCNPKFSGGSAGIRRHRGGGVALALTAVTTTSLAVLALSR